MQWMCTCNNKSLYSCKCSALCGIIQETPPWKRQLRKNITEPKVETKAIVDPKLKPTSSVKTMGSPKKDHKSAKYVTYSLLMQICIYA